MLTQANFCDMVTYTLNEKTFGAIFVGGEKGGLAVWDLGSRKVSSIDQIDRNTISGFYTRNSDSDTEFSLVAAFTNDAKTHPNISLSDNWRKGDNNQIIKELNISFTPSVLGGVGIVLGVASLFIPGLREYQILSATLSIGGLGVGLIDMVEIESFDKAQQYNYYVYHNPIPGQSNSQQFVGSQPQSTPCPPTLLYP